MNKLKETFFLIIYFGLGISLIGFWLYSYATEELLPTFDFTEKVDYTFSEKNLGFPIDEFIQSDVKYILEDEMTLFLIDAKVISFDFNQSTEVKTVALEFESQIFDVIITPDKEVPYIQVGNYYRFAGYNEISNSEIVHYIEKVFLD